MRFDEVLRSAFFYAFGNMIDEREEKGKFFIFF